MLKTTLQSAPVRVALLMSLAALAALTLLLWPHSYAFRSVDPYLPHGYCFMWDRQLVTLHVLSDAIIGLSYFAISGVLTWIVFQNRRLIPFGWMFLAFGCFIVACGVTHLMEIVVLWRPKYWLEGESKLVTAGLSLLTACVLPSLSSRIRKLLQDADASAKAEKAREQALAFSRSIINSSTFTILVTDTQGNITAMNPAAERLLWFTPAELVGKGNIVKLYDPTSLAQKAEMRTAEFCEVMEPGFDALSVRARHNLVDEGETTFLRKDGSSVAVHVTVTPLAGGEAGEGFMFTVFDITERLRSQEYVRHIATHDSLTGLPSRILFRDRLEVALARAQRYGERVAVLMLDLDNFKRINDSLGHQAGDEALVVVAQRLRESVRRTDTVARMGGDEFMVILCDVKEDAVEKLANGVLAALSAPVSLGSHQVYITASIGICTELSDGDPISVLKHADVALYKSKAEGKNQVTLYTPDMSHATVERLQMEASLRTAVAKRELHLQFQPQIDLARGMMTGIEALVRWPRSNGEVTMPTQFIPLAEETGLIVPIGEWVLHKACEEGAALIRRLGRDLTVAVNMSPRQFKDRSVFGVVSHALEASGLPARCLEIEITENMLMQGTPETLANLQRIRDLGVRVAIDDFGTGFSSMSYITRFAIDRIKIDRSFINGLMTDPNSEAVITAIIAMAHGLGIQVVAEGTETQAQAQRLIELQCDVAQGYLYSRPVEAGDLARLGEEFSLANV